MDPQQPQDATNDTNPFDQFYADQPDDQATPATPSQDVPPLPDTPTVPAEPVPVDVPPAPAPPLPAEVPPTETQPAPQWETPVADTPPAPPEPAPSLPVEETPPPPPPPTSTEEIFEAKAPMPASPALSTNHGYGAARMQMTVRKLLFGIVVFVIMIVVGLVGALVASGQLEDLTTPLTRQLYRLPFFPKTPTYVLDQMAIASMDITSFSYDFSAGFDVQNQQFDLAADGKLKLDTTGAAEEFEFNGRFKTVIAPYAGEMAFNIIGIKNGVYLKLDNITGGLSTFAQYLPPLDEWYFVDLQPLTTQARTTLQQNGGMPLPPITPLPQQLQHSITKLFSDERVSNQITLGDNEKLTDGTDTYRLMLKPTAETIVQFIADLTTQDRTTLTADEMAQLRQQVANIQKLEIDVWVDTKTYYVRKAQVVFAYYIDSSDFVNLVPGDIIPGGGTYQDTVSGAMVIELSNINTYTPVTIPPVVHPIDEYFEALSEAIAPLFMNDLQAQEGNFEFDQTFEFEPFAEDAFSF